MNITLKQTNHKKCFSIKHRIHNSSSIQQLFVDQVKKKMEGRVQKLLKKAKRCGMMAEDLTCKCGLQKSELLTWKLFRSMRTNSIQLSVKRCNLVIRTEATSFYPLPKRNVNIFTYDFYSFHIQIFYLLEIVIVPLSNQLRK